MSRHVTVCLFSTPLWGDLILYAGSAVFAVLTAGWSTLGSHRAWGSLASCGYVIAAVAVAVQLGLGRNRTSTSSARTATAMAMATGRIARLGVTGLTWVATALVPLACQVVARAGGRADRAQSEVLVIEAAGTRLLAYGTPYLDRSVIALLPPGERVLGYTPYDPAMALFGLPRALAGSATAWWADARLWFTAVTVVALVPAIWMLSSRSGRPSVRLCQAVTVLPTGALALVTGGDDLPVVTLCLLALALVATGRFGAAGVAVGMASAMKLFAAPVALVIFALALTHGKTLAWRTALGAFGVPSLAFLPCVIVNASATIDNVFWFPLGLGLVSSPARSPLLGGLVSDAVLGGRAMALAGLGLAGIGLGIWLVRRPLRDAGGAALLCAVGLALAISLMPATRFGYVLYPIAFATIGLSYRVSLRHKVDILHNGHINKS